MTDWMIEACFSCKKNRFVIMIFEYDGLVLIKVMGLYYTENHVKTLIHAGSCSLPVIYLLSLTTS